MRSATRPASGFTLLELMIAMAIGLLLTVLVAQLFVTSRQAYATTDDVSRLQENMRLASEIIGRTVRAVGYMSAPNTYSVATDGYPGVFTTSPALEGTDAGRGGGPDSFTARYEGSGELRGTTNNTLVDCLGNPTTAGVISTNVFTIQMDPATNATGLFCNGTLIAPYVENMQVTYGTDVNGDANVDFFLEIATGINTESIVAMRIALLFRSPNANIRPNPDTTVYNLNGVTFGPFNDTYIRRPLTMTIALRNRTP
jgi:type IV pilus assembly protein PilW